MNPSISHNLQGDTLFVEVTGDLDLRSTMTLEALVRSSRMRFKHCVLDLTRVDRIFDSGVAAVMVFCGQLKRIGLGCPEIKGAPTLTQRCTNVCQLHRLGAVHD